MKQLPALKYFIFSKKKINIQKFDVKIPAPNFNTMWKKPYSVYTCELRNFPICFWRSQRKLSSLRPANATKHMLACINFWANLYSGIITKRLKEILIFQLLFHNLTELSNITIQFLVSNLSYYDSNHYSCAWHNY